MRARRRLDLAGIRSAVAPAAHACGHLRSPVEFYVLRLLPTAPRHFQLPGGQPGNR
jgi:hypothetical protein